RQDGAQESDDSAARRLPGAEPHPRSHPNLGRRDYRRRPRGAGGGGVRGVGRPERRYHRSERAGRASRHQLQDRELPRLPARHLGSGAGRTRLRSGAEIRRPCVDRQDCGANSAGQAAVLLAETAKRVHMLIRADALSSTMSRYLISRIDAHPRIEQHARTEIVGLEGNGHLERVSWRTGPGGPVETQNIRHVFTMTGAEPSTGWLAGCLALDGKGFVKTGAALTVDELVAAKWPLRRQPYLLETSIPGVLAVGDVRSGSTKRVASA